MLVNLKYSRVPVTGFILYNFNQVSDAVLLVTFNVKTNKSKKIILNFLNGEWQPLDKKEMSNKALISTINKKLSLITSSNKNLLSKKNTDEIDFPDQHILLLSGYCN